MKFHVKSIYSPKLMTIAFVMAFYAFITGVFEPIMAPTAKAFGISDLQVGLIFSIAPLMTILFAPIFGKLSDVVGRRRVALFGLVVEIIAVSLYMWRPVWWVFLIGRACDAIGYSAVIYSSIAKMEDKVKDHKRGASTGLGLSLMRIGEMTAPLLGGVVADKFGVNAPFVVSIICAVILISYLFRLKTKHHKLKIERKNLNPFASLKTFLHVKELRVMILLGFFMSFIQPSLGIFLSLYIIEHLKGSYSDIGLIMFSLMIVGGSQFLIGKLVDKIGSIKLIIAGTTTVAVALILMSFSNTILHFVLSALLLSCGSAFWSTSAWCYMSKVGEKIGKEGEIVGAYASLATMGVMASMIISGAVVGAFGFKTLLVMNSVIVIWVVFMAALMFQNNG